MDDIRYINVNFTISYVNPIQSGIFVFQYDYDNDGMYELVLATADGVVILIKNDGSFLEGETFKVHFRAKYCNISDQSASMGLRKSVTFKFQIS